jgi:hypothetical protein
LIQFCAGGYALLIEQTAIHEGKTEDKEVAPDFSAVGSLVFFCGVAFWNTPQNCAVLVLREIQQATIAEKPAALERFRCRSFVTSHLDGVSDCQLRICTIPVSYLTKAEFQRRIIQHSSASNELRHEKR